jgi:hypothetical protein
MPQVFLVEGGCEDVPVSRGTGATVDESEVAWPGAVRLAR